MKKIEPQAEHRWLQRLVGEWTAHSETTDPDGNAMPPWTETGRMLGDVFVLLEGSGAMPDGTASGTLMQLGYDPAKGRFVGTFAGSMMTHLWVYSGTLEGDVLTLETEGPDFAVEGGGMTAYKDIISFEGDDRRILRSEMLGPDGTWKEVMKAEYRRKS